MDTCVVRFTPLSGARQTKGAVCYLLEIDQAKILLDCGLDPQTLSVDPELEAQLAKLSSLDAVLISHGDLAHLGALPWARQCFGWTCPVLLTVPAHHLGLLSLYDAVEGWQARSGAMPSQLPLDAIDSLFDGGMTQLRFQQPYTFFAGPAKGLTVTALPAGHGLGGALWRLKRAGSGSAGDDCLYLPPLNHRREMLVGEGALAALAASSAAHRPSLVVVDGGVALSVGQSRKDRDKGLLEHVVACLRAGGSCLLPVDTAQRCLELLLVLDAHWNSHLRALNAPWCLVGRQARRLLEQVRGMREWLRETATGGEEGDSDSRLAFNHVQCYAKLSELPASTQPRLIVAAGGAEGGLEWGAGREALPLLLEQKSSLILFPWTPPAGSLGERLLSGGAKEVELELAKEVPLEGEELQAFVRKEQAEAERRAAEAAFAALQQQQAGQMRGEDGEEAEGEEAGNQIESARALQTIRWTDYRTDWYVTEQADPTHPYFPIHPGRRPQVFPPLPPPPLMDEYGELVDAVLFKEMAPSTNTEEKVDLLPAAALAPVVRIPCKWTVGRTKLTVKCARKVVDFAGLCDGRSLITMLGGLRARRVVVVGGTPEASDYLASHLQMQEAKRVRLPSEVEEEDVEGEGGASKVYAPSSGETINLSSALLVRSCTLAASLAQQLSLLSVGLGEHQFCMLPFALKPAENDQLVLQPEEEAMVPRRALLIGDPKLSELRKLIQQQLLLPADFYQGELICAHGRVVIRKDGENDFRLEGSQCPEYYGIRDLFYSQLAIV